MIPMPFTLSSRAVRRSGTTLAALIAVAGTPAMAATPKPPMLGGFVDVDKTNGEAVEAVKISLARLHADASLAGLDVSAPETQRVESQVVAGRNFRATLVVGPTSARRVVRTWLFEPLSGASRLTRVDVGAPGATTLAADVPAIHEQPGGFHGGQAASPQARKVADEAAGLLAGSRWLGRPVKAADVKDYRSQVVAGFNHVVTFSGDIAGQPRTVTAKVFQPLGKRPPQLTWATVEMPEK